MEETSGPQGLEQCSLQYLEGVVKAIRWLGSKGVNGEARSTWGGEIKQIKSAGSFKQSSSYRQLKFQVKGL
jgi:hypothetical protein